MEPIYDYTVIILTMGMVILCLAAFAFLIFFRKCEPQPKKGIITFQPRESRSPKKAVYETLPNHRQTSGVPNSFSFRLSQRKRREAERRQP